MAALLVGCGKREVQADELPPTPWPTLAPVITPEAGVAVSEGNLLTGPELVEKFRVGIVESLTAAYPLVGSPNVPVRVEVIVLEGNPDPQIHISNANGDQLAVADSGGAGQPEVIGEFVFPGDGYYELGVSSKAGTGQVGVSVYQLQPARVDSDGLFSSTEQILRGRIDHPSSFHTFRIPLERGQRVDIGATAVQENGLDLLFELYGPDGTLRSARDDNVDINPYLWDFMPNQTGIYTLVLSNFSESTGEYYVEVKPSVSAGVVELGRRAEVELVGVPRRSTWLTIDAFAHDGISVEARPLDPEMDTSVAIYDPFGNKVVDVNRTGIDGTEALDLFQFGFSGTYQIEFTPLGESGRLEYLVLLTREADLDVGGRIATGRNLNEGDIDGAGTVIAYSFNVSAGDLVGIDAHPVIDTGLDLAFDLYSPEGYPVVSRDDVIGVDPLVDRVELSQSGQYVLVLQSKGAGVGPYELIVSKPEGAEDAPGEATPEQAPTSAEPDE